ncbi:MAG: SDR family oxidoreductase [Anaerolineae bacterium]|jgi:NAD(P)-dependent dehydrogenase (short-subunit alcohol dehydrogenase family)|nr:SDR family oxidoreductase [Anaerolineae bacterium]
MKGKVCLITGATNGIGLETARALAKQGVKVVMVGRNATKTTQIAEELCQSTGGTVETLIGDLSLIAQTRQVAEAFKARYDRLDILINNAGAIYTSRQVTAEGHELTFALNHLSYFVLTNLVLEVILDSAPARIINVSSMAHMGGKILFDDLNATQGYNGFGVYGNSKLMNVLFTYELARRLANKGVTVNALHPGIVQTGFNRNNGSLMQALTGFFTGLGRLFNVVLTPEQGAQTTLHLATSPQVAQVTGKYFSASKETPSSPLSYDTEIQRRLWEVSEQLTDIRAIV